MNKVVSIFKKVTNLDEKRKEKEEDSESCEEKQSTFDFSKIMEKNDNNSKKVQDERLGKNKKVLRSYRIK